MLTIGFSTRNHNQDFIDYLKFTSGIKEVEVIEKINDGSKSLSEVYNEIIEESKNDIIVLCHDDIYFDSKKFGEKILSHFNKSEYGILGVAGTTSLPKSGQWWEDRTKMIGIVNHEDGDKKWESKYSKDFGSVPQKTVIVDGVFMGINKKRLKHNFDESVRGFHLYDLHFCFKNFVDGVKVGVIFNVRLTHKSVGKTNEQWEENRQIFAKTYENHLPKKISIDEDDQLDILFMVSSPENYLNELEKLVGRKQKVSLITDSIDHKIKKNLKKMGIVPNKISEIPGFKLGDGKSPVKTQSGVTKSIKGEYYRTQDVKYDIIFCDDKQYFDIIKTLYSSTPKIYRNLNNEFVAHNSIVEYVEDIQNIHKTIIDSLNKTEVIRPKVKILTGYSERGGSTVAFINLTNELNKSGVDCTMYGPHKWHLDKCKSDILSNYVLEKDDRLITHVLNLNERPPVNKVIYVSHEKWWYPLTKLNHYWDTAVFLHKQHREFYNDYKGSFEIIPNLKEKLIKGNKKDGVEMVGAVIGTIEDRKQTHISIQKAIDDGCVKVKIFGHIGNEEYFNQYVKPLMENPHVELCGFSENKQDMYDSIGRVYHMSKGEVACLVKDECYMTDTLFFGNKETDHDVSSLSNEEILTDWRKLLNI